MPRGGRARKGGPRGGGGRGGRGGGRGVSAFIPPPPVLNNHGRPIRPRDGYIDTAIDHAAATAAAKPFREFSMREEARNTELHRNPWGGQLRQSPIAFVPAGALDPAELLKPINAEPREEKEEVDESEGEADAPNDLMRDDFSPLEDNGEETTDQIDVGKIDLGKDDDEVKVTLIKEQEEEVEAKMEDEEADATVFTKEEVEVKIEDGEVEDTVVKEEETFFMLDLHGDDVVDAKLAVPTVREPLPELSDASTSSEKIVFVPRGKRNAQPSEPATRQLIPARTITTQSAPPIVLTESSKAAQPEEDFIKLKNPSTWNKKRVTQGNKHRKPNVSRRRKDKEDDPAFRDYLENITAQIAEESESGGGKATNMVLRELGGGPGDDLWADADTDTDDEEDDENDEEAIRRYRAGWDADCFREFDDISTDEEYPRGLVSAILRKRIRPSGVQYLIKWDGYEIEDATWILKDKLDSSADAKIKRFEADILEVEKKQNLAESSGSESDGESDDEEGEEDDDGEEEEVDTDEDLKLAQLLQRQEELQMMGVDTYDEIMDLDDEFFPMGVGKKSKAQKRASRRAIPDITPDRSGRYPSASQMAVEYDGFDVMDWQRASLASIKQKKGKGRIAAAVLNLSDSELEATLHRTWRKDREKKKLRKIQRQELRLQGLLGVNSGKPDLKEKYKAGITRAQAFEEIKNFMLRDHNSIALPPMNKLDRKLVHELAAKLNCTSKSIGKGRSRFTTIIKTSRSALYEGDEEAIDDIFRVSSFAKHHFSKSEKIRRQRPAGWGHGMVVGADAPVIGADNRGRQMLEKMGYKAGMTLGVEGNGRGIAEPVMAIMRMGKAGLG